METVITTLHTTLHTTLVNQLDAIAHTPKYIAAIEASIAHATTHADDPPADQIFLQTDQLTEFYAPRKRRAAVTKGKNQAPAFDNMDIYGHLFSNCIKSPIIIDDVAYPSTEHYFQMVKFDVSDDVLAQFAENRGCAVEELATTRRAFMDQMLAATPVQVANKGRSMRDLPINPHWDTARIDVMYRALQEKVVTNGEFVAALKETGDKVIIERTKSDPYWGITSTGGHNMLGRMLMLLRANFM